MSLDDMVLDIQRYLKENYHPHVEINIDSTSYQIKEVHFNSGNTASDGEQLALDKNKPA